jgi:hypothetical protein
MHRLGVLFANRLNRKVRIMNCNRLFGSSHSRVVMRPWRSAGHGWHHYLLILLMAFVGNRSVAQTALDEESPWPRVRSTNGHTVTICQPQVESWTSNTFSARAAVEVKLADAKRELFGVVWFSATGRVDQSSRIVTLDRMEITKARFPDAADGGSNAVAVLRDVVPVGARTVSLDYLVAALGFTQAAARQGAHGFRHTPPEIIWVTNHTVLVLIDGEPKLRPVSGSKLQRVLNTPALLVNDGTKFYLAGDGLWFSSAGLDGPWSLVQVPPAEVSALLPAAPRSSPRAAGEIVPRILVRTKPAELLVTSGLPDFRGIRGTALQYAADTDGQLFFNTKEREAYLLLSGRWFKAASLQGPWSYVAPQDLPEDFSKIPPGSPQAVVLASVPDTREAELALLANSVPTTATVKRRDAKIELAYDGEPQFKPITGTAMSYVVNASLPVILCGGSCYAVDNGVWFTAKTATGPWEVATEVPEEIYTIPPDSPVYYATFAEVYQSTDEEVEVGYTSGYLGAYEEDGTVVYGTGWDYDCWCEDEYYGWGWSWGYGYYYVPWYQWWVWRNWWDHPGSPRMAVIENIYDRWQDRNGVVHHDLLSGGTAGKPRATAGNGNFPALYGRFKGSTRPAPMAPPANTLALNPYARPKNVMRAGEIPHGAKLLTTVRQSSGGGRDLYASPDGSVYQRKADGWYRRQAAGKWDFVAPTQGTIQRSQAKGTQPGAGVPRVTATSGASGRGAQRLGERIPDSGREAMAGEIQALEREYYARSLAQLRSQGNRSSGNVNRPVRSGGRRR